MCKPIKTSFFFYIFALFLCAMSLFLRNTAAQVNITPVAAPDDSAYTFEGIEVPGVDFLELTASSDFGDYAGNTKSEDGTKTVGFTLIDGVFTRHDFPNAKNTYFYALGNNGNAAGHYEDSEGLFHGIVLKDGALREYNFPNAVETEIYGYSDATGALTGTFTDADGIRRGFTGDDIVAYPGASETFADFVAAGRVVGSYIDAAGIYYPYLRLPTGEFVSLDLPTPVKLEWFFIHGINDERIVVARAKAVDGPPRTWTGLFMEVELKFPGSVSTEGWNINQDGSIVGNYVSADGRRLGFIARPVTDTAAPIEGPPVMPAILPHYTFETFDVPGVDFLAVTTSNDFQDYAGYTRRPNDQKEVAFTLIDGVFTTYDFPGSQNTYFYALGNDGRAAGYYEDSEGLHHGVILEDGELRQYDFTGAVETFISSISDTIGELTGSFIDAAGVRRGFSDETVVEYPDASATYAEILNPDGSIIGSFVDAHGDYYPYVRIPDGRFVSIEVPHAHEYLFVHSMNAAGIIVVRSHHPGEMPGTEVGSLQRVQTLKVPGSVSTQGYHVNQDSSIVGYYDSPDGRRHGFIARPVDEAESTHFGNVYTVTLSKGLNMLSVPLAPPTPMTAKSLAALTGATTLITLDAATQQFVAWTPNTPDDGFPIEGGHGYIVNVPQTRNFAFVGAPWTDQTEAAAAPAISKETPQKAWAFVVSGHLKGKPTFDGYQVSVRNLRTNRVVTASVQGDYFAAATADLTRRSVVHVGDVVELRVIGPDGNFESQTLKFEVTPDQLSNAVLSVRLDGIGKPTQNLLLQNYPNPLNPETWIPYQLSADSLVSVFIYDTTGKLIRTLSLGFQSAGFYNSRERAVYWDGRNELGESVASGLYFYTLTAGDFTATRKMLILK